MNKDHSERAKKLAAEYRPSMDRDIVHAWAVDVVALLREMAGPDWIPWEGGDNPLPAGSRFAFRFRNGREGWGVDPEAWAWADRGADYDIVAYRLTDGDA